MQVFDVVVFEYTVAVDVAKGIEECEAMSVSTEG
jgi:hypothetical protein